MVEAKETTKDERKEKKVRFFMVLRRTKKIRQEGNKEVMVEGIFE